MRYEELMDKLRNRSIKYDELEELKEIVEERIRICEEREECDEAVVEHSILKIVEDLWRNID